MARAPQNLDTRQISTTDLTELYTAPAAIVASGLHLVLTNAATTANNISVYFNDGTTNYLLANRTLPGGAGKTWMVAEVAGLKLNAGDKLLVQAGSATAYNVNLSGTEVT